MTSVATHEFPSPVGGAPLPVDFAPSILFSVLHALLVPIFAWRLARTSTRQFALIPALIYTIERSVLYALRAHAAHDAGARTSEILETYLQTSLAGGFISIGIDLMHVTRSLLVNSTKGSDALVIEAKQIKTKKPDWESDASVPSYEFAMEDSASIQDHPHTRARIRRAMLAVTILFWTTIIMEIVAGIDYQNAIHDGAHASLVRQLWYASTVLGLLLLVGLAVSAVWAFFTLPRVPRSSTAWIVLVAALASTVAIYRLVVMRLSTTSLLSDAPGSLNSLQSKITFYVFHSAPEYLAAAILITLDVRRVFATGLWGDRRLRDPKPKV